MWVVTSSVDMSIDSSALRLWATCRAISEVGTWPTLSQMYWWMLLKTSLSAPTLPVWRQSWHAARCRLSIMVHRVALYIEMFCDDFIKLLLLWGLLWGLLRCGV